MRQVRHTIFTRAGAHSSQQRRYHCHNPLISHHPLIRSLTCYSLAARRAEQLLRSVRGSFPPAACQPEFQPRGTRGERVLRRDWLEASRRALRTEDVAGNLFASRVGRNKLSSNQGRLSSEDTTSRRLTTSALSSPSGSHPIASPQSSPLPRSPSKKAPSAAESPSVATAAAAGVASTYLSTSTATANFEASYSASLPLTVPHLAAPLDLSPNAHHQTRFAVALAAQLSLFSVLALLQPVSALALAQSARGTASARTFSGRSSASSSASSSANATLALLPTCPATWHEKDAAAAAVSDSDGFEADRSLSKSTATKRQGKRRGSRRLITTAKATGAAVAEEAVAGGDFADTFAALAGDDWVPQNGNGAARGSSNGNGRGLWGGVRGGDAAAGRGEWQAVSLAEAREMAEPPFKVAAPGQRIVAIGDVHGDWQQTLAALRVAGVLNEKDGVSDDEMWTGGSTVLVQVGDVLDRGDDEIAILSLLRHLDRLAQREGGGVLMLNGNHETMNVAEEFRYVSDGGFEESEDFYSFCLSECAGDWDSAFRVWWQASQELKATKRRRKGPWNGWNPIQGQRQVRERHELFEVGGPMAAELARNGAALMVNDTLFAHGGILPHHVEYGLPRMNRELSQWMRGEEVWGEGGRSPMPFIVTRGFNSVVWTRLYSQEYLGSGEDKYKICAVLAASLDAVGARRLVVGHTPQVGGANGECGGRVWRIDVGMSSGMLNAPPQVLEIVGDSVQSYSYPLGNAMGGDGGRGGGGGQSRAFGCEEEDKQRFEAVDARGSSHCVDERAAATWIYPSNRELRQYQYEIAEAALFANTLVCLPTGVGKTLIAAVVMANYYRWFPYGQ
ncbi:unnamed protein product [Closterium sp. Yama58-4]|nr:unnamed protein product [Closterium sp. Yama58-4]